MILKKIVGAGAIAGALSFSALGLAGVANAAATPETGSGVVHHAQLVGRGGGGGFHGGGGGFHGGSGGFHGGGPGFNHGFGGPGFNRGFGGPGFGGPGFGRGFGGPGWGRPGWGGPPPPCLFGLCV